MRLPPLNALRAFDAVARQGSVKDAATELSVTAAAISQQLKVLEDNLGTKLIERSARGIALTRAGQEFHRETSRHLRAIADAAARIRPQRKSVSVTVLPSFAARWLVPRLPHFTAANPNIEVRVDANLSLSDLRRDYFDLAIRESRGQIADGDYTQLLSAAVTPLATPGYIKQRTRKKQFDWAQATLLHEVRFDWWSQWLDMAGVKDVDTARGLYFSHTMLSLAAAMDEQGVALAPTCLVRNELAAGTLVPVDVRAYDNGYGYYLVWPQARDRRMPEPVLRFKEWLLEEAKAEQQTAKSANQI